MPSLAKLTRPKVHRAVPRPALYARLDEARARPLVWIFGPPGAGKSMLAASYVAERRLRCAWYHVDAGDADPGAFFYYLADAVPPAKRAAPLPLLAPEQRADLAGFSRLYFRQFFARVDVLVLDNYHELPDEAPLHDVLDHALAEAPDGAGVLVVSRAAPTARFVRHELADRMATIDGAALRLSFDETRALAAPRGAIDHATLERIHALAGGWAAGVTLALQRTNLASHDEHEAVEAVFEFFARQVVDALPPDEQAFLERTALLPTMTAASADALTGRTDAARVLEHLYRRGLFTERRGAHPRRYQYHDLFRTFLQRRHASRGTAAQLAEECRRAGRLLEEDGQADHAIRLYLSARDWDAAIGALRRIAGTLLPQGRDASVREWLDALPPERVAADPWLGFWSGMAEVRRRPELARVDLERAFRQFAAQEAPAPQALACAGVVIGYMYEFTDLRPLDPWIDELLALRARGVRLPTVDAALLVERALLFALSFRRPLRDELEACVARMLDLLAGEVKDDDAAMACSVLMLHHYGVGDVTRAARLAHRLEPLLAHGAVPPLTRALAMIQLGHYHHARGDLAASERTFGDVLALVTTHALALPIVPLYAHLGLAFCALEAGDLDAAEAHEREVARHWSPSRRLDQFASVRVRLWIACRRGRWDAAQSLAVRQIESAEATGVFWMRFESRVQRALVAIELGREAEADAALAEVPALLEGSGYERFRYQVELVHAYAALRRGDRSACHARLRAGLAASREDEGKIVLRMHPALLPTLCDVALAAGIESDCASEIVRTLRLPPPADAGSAWPWPLRVLTLGRFEVQRDGRPLEYSRKSPKKTLALLKALIAFGGRAVREQRLLDTFWPDEEGDVAARSLGAAVHRLRVLLGDADAVDQHGGTLSLDPRRVWVDAWAFERLVAAPGVPPADELLGLYRGTFLREDDGEPWTVTMRERLRGRFVHAVGDVGRRLEEGGDAEAAIACYLRGLDADPVVEPFYQGLMRCYARLGRRSEALSAYQRLKRLLSISLGVAPSAQSERLYQALRLDA